MMWYEILLIFLFIIIVVQGPLLIYFVRWVLWRNEKLSILIAEYYERKALSNRDEEE